MNEHINPPATPTEETPKESPRAKWPKAIQELFFYPPLLFGEKQSELEELFDSYVEAVGAKTRIEFDQVYDATMLQWEIRRYQFRRMQLTVNQTRQAVRNTFAMFENRATVMTPEPIARDRIETKTEKYFSDALFQDDVIEACNMEDYSIEAATLALALPDIAALDRLIASAQKRLIQILNSVEKRCAARRAAAANANGETQQR